jgi:hypothetical protein
MLALSTDGEQPVAWSCHPAADPRDFAARTPHLALLGRPPIPYWPGRHRRPFWFLFLPGLPSTNCEAPTLTPPGHLFTPGPLCLLAPGFHVRLATPVFPWGEPCRRQNPPPPKLTACAWPEQRCPTRHPPPLVFAPQGSTIRTSFPTRTHPPRGPARDLRDGLIPNRPKGRPGDRLGSFQSPASRPLASRKDRGTPSRRGSRVAVVLGFRGPLGWSAPLSHGRRLVMPPYHRRRNPVSRWRSHV